MAKTLASQAKDGGSIPLARSLPRERLTAALAHRQHLTQPARLDPVAATEELLLLQAQYSPSPYVSLWARLDGFRRDALEAALAAGEVVKATLLRETLHLATAERHRALAAAWHARWLELWRAAHEPLGIDEDALRAALAAFLAEPRTAAELRERVIALTDGRIQAGSPRNWAQNTARALVPVVHARPAGFWREHGRARYVRVEGALPEVVEATADVVRGHLAAYGPASRRDVARFSGLTQRQLAPALERLEPLARFRDEDGRELLDLPGGPLPEPGDVALPPRLLGRFDQAVLAHADRVRILPPEVERAWPGIVAEALVLVDGRAAGFWREEPGGLALTALRPLRARERRAVEAEAERLATWMDEGRDRIRWDEDPPPSWGSEPRRR